MRTAEFDRDRVLDVAMEVFWEKGYNDASIQDLSQATGLQRSSLYNTFSSKRELYLATLRRYHSRCTEQYAVLASASDPLAAVRDLVESVIVDELGDRRGLGCMVANAALEFGGRDREVNALTAYNLTTMAEAIRSAIHRAQRLGHVPDTLDPVATAQAIVVTIQGLRVAAKGVAGADREQWLRTAAQACLVPLTR
ncbi:TetR/AcrR family transcriptional regulator [Nocardia sp. NBC_01377]|uniref:TetR/AcrR family transcriptional regulator n=1 Tax=Nocardia sp. NBC_01377 TaxID=2903595 RepID=UPI003255EF74